MNRKVEPLLTVAQVAVVLGTTERFPRRLLLSGAFDSCASAAMSAFRTDQERRRRLAQQAGPAGHGCVLPTSLGGPLARSSRSRVANGWRTTVQKRRLSGSASATG
jgi:hypothetical protein